MHFYINGIEWSVVFANSNNDHFQRSNGTYSVGVTDRGEKKIYLSDKLQGPFLRKVFTHEVWSCGLHELRLIYAYIARRKAL